MNFPFWPYYVLGDFVGTFDERISTEYEPEVTFNWEQSFSQLLFYYMCLRINENENFTVSGKIIECNSPTRLRKLKAWHCEPAVSGCKRKQPPQTLNYPPFNPKQKLKPDFSAIDKENATNNFQQSIACLKQSLSWKLEPCETTRTWPGSFEKKFSKNSDELPKVSFFCVIATVVKKCSVIA